MTDVQALLSLLNAHPRISAEHLDDGEDFVSVMITFENGSKAPVTVGGKESRSPEHVYKKIVGRCEPMFVALDKATA